MSTALHAPPVLSTPAEHIFEEAPSAISSQQSRLVRSDDELSTVYEIARTAAEIQKRGWTRLALQFPDDMLADAPWVVGALDRELKRQQDSIRYATADSAEHFDAGAATGSEAAIGARDAQQALRTHRLYILADTAYSACCVDEIAAEHAAADAVVHYGRACLSPTARLPVLHIFTRQRLDCDFVVEAIARELGQLGGTDTKVVVMADVMYQEHVAPVCALLQAQGFMHLAATQIIHDPSAIIPNRAIPSLEPVSAGAHDYDLHEYHLVYISTPPTSLLLTLSSRLASLRIFPAPSEAATAALPDPGATPSMLRRRYALVLRLATASIIGILVNTLSVKNYMSTISTLREQIAAAGKKSYTIVVGKLNAAKLANFAEIDGWVVVGCWESGLVDQDGLFRPVITPFELGLALQSDEKRIWTGEWWGGIEGVKDDSRSDTQPAQPQQTAEEDVSAEYAEGDIDDEESEPPVFDLRTGKLVSNSRPMRMAIRNSASTAHSTQPKGDNTPAQAVNSALVKRNIGEIALVNGVASPGAEFLRSKRTWQGLGSDFNPEEDETSAVVEEGRSGIARGYTVGEEPVKS
ncbi:putative diphthamide synthesis protein-domain-containing protein [Nemania sp. FL0916]|nr:putative diphthamide synthesis protein-domain-containing protein [Nemania sp. FL0916]